MSDMESANPMDLSRNIVRQVSTLFPKDKEYAQAGDFRLRGNTPGGHPADGMIIDVSMGGGAVVSIINPQSFENGGPEWACRYGNVESIRYAVAGLLESYDYLLSSNINMSEATRRLRLMRATRRAALENR